MCTLTSISTHDPFVPSIHRNIISLTSITDLKINTLCLKIISRPYIEQVENSDLERAELRSNLYYKDIFDVEFNAEFTIDLYITTATILVKSVIERIKREGIYGEIECELIITGDIKIDQGTTNCFTITIKKTLNANTATNVFEYELLGLDELPQNADPETTNPETAL